MDQREDEFAPNADELLENNARFAATYSDRALELYPRRRLVIVACDGIEHLLAVGPQATTVLSSKPAQPAAPAFAAALAEAKAEQKTDEAA